MNYFKADVPIYLQLRQEIEEQILDYVLREEDQIKSYRALAAEYRINPITVGNAINQLVAEGILYQKRGIGVFVAPSARKMIIRSRRQSFLEDTLEPALRLARSYEVPLEEIISKSKSIYGEEK